jgi:thermitase
VPRHVPNELIIRVKPGVDVQALAKSLGAKIIGSDPKLGIYRLQFDNEADTDSAMTTLKSDSDVLAVDYNYYYDPPLSPQALANAPTGPVSLSLNPPNTDDCANLTVGLIDTPVQSLGANLNQFMLPSISVTGDAATPSSTAITHGTGMAQTILAAISQAEKGNSSVKILPVDVYGNSATTTSWNVALGVQAAVNKGATVLNLSLGSSGDSTVLDSILQQAFADGIIIFAAAGNEPVATPTYPAASLDVNAVTALSAPGQLASYADYGPFVNMALPGTSVVYLGNTAYGMQGTSVSTAYASGIAAGTRSGNCGLTWPQIQTSMVKSYPVPSK